MNSHQPSKLLLLQHTRCSKTESLHFSPAFAHLDLSGFDFDKNRGFFDGIDVCQNTRSAKRARKKAIHVCKSTTKAKEKRLTENAEPHVTPQQEQSRNAQQKMQSPTRDAQINLFTGCGGWRGVGDLEIYGARGMSL